MTSDEQRERDARFMVHDEEIEIVSRSGSGLHVPIEALLAARARVAAGEDIDAVAHELALQEVAIQVMLDNPEMVGKDENRALGGPGSGNFGHEGRPGKVGGSGPGDGDIEGASLQKPDGKIPEADWSIPPDKLPGDSERNAIKGWIDLNLLDEGLLSEEEDSLADREGTDEEGTWEVYTPDMTDYSRPFPPITVTTDGEGGFAILDGNHRVRSWRDEGFTHAPAWIFDDRDEKRVE